MALYEELCGRRYCSPVGWFESGEARLLGTDVVHNSMEKGLMRFGKKGKFSLRYIGPFKVLDSPHVLDFRSMQLDKNLASREDPVAILDRHVWKLKSKDIESLKV
ncbi:uncharacterized protein [Nicotiana tomentosiformis]|uniref:uncharacterized protein n=1 Tax=Nicotiana tomentosiformis TaxID=4098 RepID=UPI00388CE546